MSDPGSVSQCNASQENAREISTWRNVLQPGRCIRDGYWIIYSTQPKNFRFVGMKWFQPWRFVKEPLFVNHNELEVFYTLLEYRTNSEQDAFCKM